MTMIYLLAMILSSIMLIFLIKVFDYKVSSIYALVFLTVTICDYGYINLIHARTVEEALLANSVTYLGGCFVPFFMLIGVCKLCNFKQKAWAVIFEFACCLVCFYIVATSGRNELNYRVVSLDTSGTYSKLIKEYGPYHNIYTMGMILFAIITYGVIIWSYQRKRDVSYKTAICLALICTVAILTYILERILHISVELMPIAYFITEIGLFILLNRVKMYDVSAVVSDYYSTAQEYGFVLFDRNLNYMGSNDVAEKWAPDLLELHVDRKITITESEFLKNALQVMEGGEQREFYISYENRVIKNSVKILYNEKKTVQIGYYVEMVDDTERQNHVKLVEKYNKDLEREVKEKTRSLVKMQDDIILSMADTVENRDSNTGGHIRRTSEGVRILVSALKENPFYAQYDDSFFECVVKAAPLHDFGKIAVDDAILRKPGKFTEEEYEIMKIHPEKGAQIVARILQNSNDEQFRKIAENVAHYHHEKWDGKGYPTGLSGEDIPLEARIMALADVFDALVSKRCYKEEYSFDKAFSIIEESLGQHFDPELGRIFIQQREALEEYYKNI